MMNLLDREQKKELDKVEIKALIDEALMDKNKKIKEIVRRGYFSILN